MKRKGKQTHLSAGLDKLASRLNRTNDGALDQARISAAWDEIAGPTVMAHTTGAHIRQGELIVFVDSPLWATELSALSDSYRQALNEKAGANLVRSVRFSVSRKVQAQRKREKIEEQTETHYTKDRVESVPLSEIERMQVESSAEDIEDPELREAVIRATIADLEWKKGIRQAKSREGAREGS